MKKVSYFLFLMFVIGCTEVSKSELTNLESEVMRIHDESMLGMSEIKSLKKELIKTKVILVEAETTDSRLIADVDLAVDELVLADSLMWDWMHNYSKPSFKDGVKAKQYLQAEFIKIKRVDSLMNTSVENGIKILDKIKAQ